MTEATLPLMSASFVQNILDNIACPNHAYIACIQADLVQGFEGEILVATEVLLMGQHSGFSTLD